jgi:hypothetical protein
MVSGTKHNLESKLANRDVFEDIPNVTQKICEKCIIEFWSVVFLVT